MTDIGKAKGTGEFPSTEGHGAARRERMEAIGFKAAAEMQANPQDFRVCKDEEGKNMSPQGNPEDTAYKQGRTIPGA
jgi:hypothetical protein